ncbi:helix-turn-helix domain-containing protein [Curtobacterium flaccumfaciens pv. poinsettiae]|uniref:AraC family transcriptional regulator n=1 Tax=Curtobacterium poinsettiae TaxID=159612 RepID=UPI001BDF77B1|nr:helix-turn-helix domain-containing protein [Curtobacterium flaccumfaciens]MBT1617878.1 helix-turn-helix domain-containing protein [Curtobacterium flaccumfaciens pv. poinsettiae]
MDARRRTDGHARLGGDAVPLRLDPARRRHRDRRRRHRNARPARRRGPRAPTRRDDRPARRSLALALRHVGHLDGGRWHGAQQQALARLVVTTVLRDNPPPMLGDNGLARILDRLFDPAGQPSVRALLADIDMSERTLERRCVAATGCSPAQLGRWYRSLAVRSALTRGDRPSDVATRFGFSTTSSMRRALDRVRPPRNRR